MFDPFRDLSRAPKSKFRTVLAHILIFPAGRPSKIFIVRNGLYRRPTHWTTCSSCIFVVFSLSRIWRYFGPLQRRLLLHGRNTLFQKMAENLCMGSHVLLKSGSQDWGIGIFESKNSFRLWVYSTLSRCKQKHVFRWTKRDC